MYGLQYYATGIDDTNQRTTVCIRETYRLEARLRLEREKKKRTSDVNENASSHIGVIFQKYQFSSGGFD